MYEVVKPEPLRGSIKFLGSRTKMLGIGGGGICWGEVFESGDELPP